MTFFSVERAVERAMCAYDSDARRSNSDPDSRGVSYFFSFFDLVIIMGIFTQTIPTSLGAALRHLSTRRGILGSNRFLYFFIFFRVTFY